MFDENDTETMPMHNFQQMIGFIGDSFLGERMFYVVKQSRLTDHQKGAFSLSPREANLTSMSPLPIMIQENPESPES